MKFSLQSALALFLASIPSSSALPAATKFQVSPSFTLRASLYDAVNTSFANLSVTSYHTGPGTAYAVLAPGPGRIAHLNGTEEELDHENGNMVFEGSSFPSSFIIDRVNQTYNPIEINAGEGGTPGIFIDQGFIKVHDPLSGGFY
ncbi:MAG: hypothetical protein Q9187_002330, partial [Circinaria calcarea]